MVVFNSIAMLLLFAAIVIMLVNRATFLSPVLPIALMWLVSTFLYAIFFSINSAAISVALIMMLSLFYSYVVGGSLSNTFGHGGLDRPIARNVEERIVGFPALYIFTFVSGVALNFLLIQQSGGFGNGVTGILGSANYFSKLRYQEGLGIPLTVRALNVVVYIGMAVSLLVFWERLWVKKRKSFILLAPILFLLLESLLIGTKSIAVLCFVYAVTSFIIISHYHRIPVNKGRLFLKLIAVVAVLFLFVVAVHYIRADGRLSVLSIAGRILTSYLLMPFIAFLEWFPQADNGIFIGNWKGNLFAGITTHLVDDYVKVGDFLYINLSGQIYQTNVYTALRPLIEDFGVIGGVIFMSVLGIALGYSLKRVSCGAVLFIPLVFALSDFVLFSFAASLYKYLTNIAVVGGLFLYFLVSKIFWRSK